MPRAGGGRLGLAVQADEFLANSRGFFLDLGFLVELHTALICPVDLLPSAAARAGENATTIDNGIVTDRESASVLADHCEHGVLQVQGMIADALAQRGRFCRGAFVHRDVVRGQPIGAYWVKARIRGPST
jgi:hypothetical protein